MVGIYITISAVILRQQGGDARRTAVPLSQSRTGAAQAAKDYGVSGGADHLIGEPPFWQQVLGSGWSM
jgi:hypothetical protein